MTLIFVADILLTGYVTHHGEGWQSATQFGEARRGLITLR